MRASQGNLTGMSPEAWWSARHFFLRLQQQRTDNSLARAGSGMDARLHLGTLNAFAGPLVHGPDPILAPIPCPALPGGV